MSGYGTLGNLQAEFVRRRGRSAKEDGLLGSKSLMLLVLLVLGLLRNLAQVQRKRVALGVEQSWLAWNLAVCRGSTLAIVSMRRWDLIMR